MSQPSVSRNLARLREQFNDRLLVRTNTGMVPTPFAETLQQPLSQWMAAGQTLLSGLTSEGHTVRRTFHIASTDFGMMKVIAPVLGGIYQSMPGVKIVVSPLSETSEKALADGTLDLIVTGFDPDRSAVHGEKLFEERRLCLARPDHPLFEQQPINLDRFLAYPHAAVTVAGNCADTIEDALPPGRHRQLILRTPVFSVAPHLAASSDVVITLPASAAELYAEQHGLRVFEPPLNLGAFNYWLCWHERSQRDPSTLWLVDQLSAPFRASNGRKAAPDRTSIEVEAA